jgi:type VI secretion system secreted protein Hcp
MSQYLDIPGIPGESQSPNPNWNAKIELDTMSYGISQATTKKGSGGLLVSKAKFDNLHITKSMDKSTPALLGQLAGSKPIPLVTVRVSRAGANTGGAYAGLYEAESYALKNVRFVSYHTSGQPGVTGLPGESWTLSFSGITETYQTLDATGNLQPPQTGGFDVVGGQVTG